MVIGVIGAGLSGLIAAKELSLAGHEVIVFEKERSQGGRVASKIVNDNIVVDPGLSYFSVQSDEFRPFVDELKQKELIAEWTDHFGLYDDITFHEINPNRDFSTYYCAPGGMQSIVKHLSRWVDVRSNVQVGGLTHIGRNRRVKRSWMINLTNISVEEVDAVIIATPAIPAYGILHITQDETPSKKISSILDEVRYDCTYAYSFGWGNKTQPGWRGVEINSPVLNWISNEASKRPDQQQTAFVAKSTHAFGIEHIDSDPETVMGAMDEEIQRIMGDNYHFPEWRTLDFWRHAYVRNPIDQYFIEMEMEEAPLALVGDYFMGHSFEDAYLSGYKLAQKWIDKYS